MLVSFLFVALCYGFAGFSRTRTVCTTLRMSLIQSVQHSNKVGFFLKCHFVCSLSLSLSFVFSSVEIDSLSVQPMCMWMVIKCINSLQAKCHSGRFWFLLNWQQGNEITKFDMNACICVFIEWPLSASMQFDYKMFSTL